MSSPTWKSPENSLILSHECETESDRYSSASFLAWKPENGLLYYFSPFGRRSECARVFLFLSFSSPLASNGLFSRRSLKS